VRYLCTVFLRAATPPPEHTRVHPPNFVDNLLVRVHVVCEPRHHRFWHMPFGVVYRGASIIRNRHHPLGLP